jgi:hypothetical protein
MVAMVATGVIIRARETEDNGSWPTTSRGNENVK